MVRLSTILLSPALFGLLLCPIAQGEESIDAEQHTLVIGKKAGANFTAENLVGTTHIKASATVHILGAALQALVALSRPDNTIGGTTYTEVYSFGRRVFDGSYLNINENGAIVVGIPPTQIRVPIVMYPVGPLLLEIDGGARFQARLSAQNMSTFVIPLELSTIGIDLQARAMAAGFIEGYAKFFVIRGGVGGQLDLIDARGSVAARFGFDGANPLVTASGMVEFLNGRLYAFLDVFLVWTFGWKRLLDYDLYSWNGYCYSTRDLMCPAK